MRSSLFNPSARAVAKAATRVPAIRGGTKTSALLGVCDVLIRRLGTGGFMMLRIEVEGVSTSWSCVVDSTGGSGGGIVIL